MQRQGARHLKQGGEDGLSTLKCIRAVGGSVETTGSKARLPGFES